jgi:hypothetical protein
VEDFRDWEWSSYPTLVGTEETSLKRNEVLDLFGGLNGFEDFHQGMVDEKKLTRLVDEDFEMETQT